MHSIITNHRVVRLPKLHIPIKPRPLSFKVHMPVCFHIFLGYFFSSICVGFFFRKKNHLNFLLFLYFSAFASNALNMLDECMYFFCFYLFDGFGFFVVNVVVLYQCDWLVVWGCAHFLWLIVKSHGFLQFAWRKIVCHSRTLCKGKDPTTVTV